MKADGYRYLDLLESAEVKVMKFYRKVDPAKIVPRMTPSDDLDSFTKPADRYCGTMPREIACDHMCAWQAFNSVAKFLL